MLSVDQEVTSPVVIEPHVETPTHSNIPNVSHVTRTNLQDDLVANPSTEENQERTMSAAGENTPGKGGPQRKVLGKTLQTKHVDEIYDGITIKRALDPPLVPLCRLVPHEAIRTATSSLTALKALFDDTGYSEKGSPPFFISLRRPGSLEYLKVSTMDKTLWGPVWTQISDDFDSKLPNEWQDLRGKKFLVWDGNHRVKAWLQVIRESKSILVMNSIISIPFSIMIFC